MVPAASTVTNAPAAVLVTADVGTASPSAVLAVVTVTAALVPSRRPAGTPVKAIVTG